ncbi:MAG TPA: DUF4097 family beta strand repeat-containing protein [Candidatus Cybelea sp.]|jgi:DUF4097 and DUF4098 domain-containing protein YvlB
MMRAVLPVVALTLCACTAAYGERVHEQFHQTLESGNSPSVTVDNVAGTVTIQTWTKASVDVSATKYGYDASQLRGITIGVSSGAAGISIKTHYESDDHSGGVRYTITVPVASSLDVGNVAGSVRVAGVTGNVIVETQAGTVDALLGRVDGNRSIDLRATTGTIALRIARDSSASVEAQSVVGSFSSDFPGIGQSRENIVGSRAAGKIGAGTARIRLATTTGAISIRTMQ